jgi:head-tail adaptor
MLTASELAQIRADVALLLPDTCALLTATTSSGGMGGWSETWGTALASVACRLDPVRGSEQQAGGAVQPFYSYVLTLPYNTAINANYRVLHGGQTYNVKSVDADKSWQASVRVYLERA